MKKNVKSLDGLISGIKQLLSEDRCSFSDEEKVLLENTVTAFEQFKIDEDLSKLSKAFGILIKMFTVMDYLKDLF